MTAREPRCWKSRRAGSASTLTVVSQIRALLPHILSGLPKSLHVQPLSDQSVFVLSAIDGVLHEALVAARTDSHNDPAVPG